MYLLDFWHFLQAEMTDFPTLLYISISEIPTLSYTGQNPCKGTPYRAELPRKGHYREHTPGSECWVKQRKNSWKTEQITLWEEIFRALHDSVFAHVSSSVAKIILSWCLVLPMFGPQTAHKRLQEANSDRCRGCDIGRWQTNPEAHISRIKSLEKLMKHNENRRGCGL